MLGRKVDPLEQQVRERVQARLALSSMLLWFIVTFAAVVPLRLIYEIRAPLVLLIGFLALAVAALPWLAYGRMVESRLRRERERREA
jgi:uncharacterized membrane protein